MRNRTNLLKLLIGTLVLSALLWLLGRHQPFGSPLPALGPLLYPPSGAWQQAESATIAPMDLESPYLDGPVEIVFDDRQVPHVFAQTDEDAFFAQGYLHAYFRLWQMDISWRASGGFLSEVLGERTIEHDRKQRKKGILAAAHDAVVHWQKHPKETALLEAYIQGINARIEQLTPETYPIEYKLMGFEPTPWTKLKTALFYKRMVETLSYRHYDVAATNTRELLGDSLYQSLFEGYDPRQFPVIPPGTSWTYIAQDTTPAPVHSLGYQKGPDWPMPPEHVGSNNWAVNGTKTASGYPILCNDPHLNLTYPSIWFELQMQTPEWNAYGASLAGNPGIMSGFNEDIAWGVTNVGQDVLDWYAISWVDDSKSAYWLDDEKVPVEYHVDTIKVRGGATLFDTTLMTYWGPVAYEGLEKGYDDLALKWLGQYTAEERDMNELGAFYLLMSGENYEDYLNATKNYKSPAQNFVFAAKDGDIAMTVTGAFPQRKKRQGRFVQDGGKSSNDWGAYIPFEHLPRVKNPPQQFVSSANQTSTTPDYPYAYFGGFDHYRGRYIAHYLDSLNEVTVADMKALQLDGRSLHVDDQLPVMLAGIEGKTLSATGQRLVDSLRHWDGSFRADALAPSIFKTWCDSTYRLTFDELRSKNGLKFQHPQYWAWIDMMINQPTHPLFDIVKTDTRESLADLLVMALEQVAARYEKEGEEQMLWREVIPLSINHLARIPAFSTQGGGVDGYHLAPNAYSGGFGPSWRMVVALGEIPEAWGIYPGGISGNPMSPYYEMQTEPWRTGVYYRLAYFQSSDDADWPVQQRWQWRTNANNR